MKTLVVDPSSRRLNPGNCGVKVQVVAHSVDRVCKYTES